MAGTEGNGQNHGGGKSGMTLRFLNTNAPCLFHYTRDQTSLKQRQHFQAQGMRLACIHPPHSLFKNARTYQLIVSPFGQHFACRLHSHTNPMAPKQASIGYVKPAQTTLGSVILRL